jgi:hypothetical protein
MDQLQLSQSLIDSIQDTLVAADARAREPAVAVQYLMAIAGYALGAQNISSAAKQETFEELMALAHHVMEDVQQQKQAQVKAAGSAFGIWRPGDP